MSDQIITGPQNDAYRAGWERAFGKHSTEIRTTHDPDDYRWPRCQGCGGPLDENGECPAEEKVRKQAEAIRSM